MAHFERDACSIFQLEQACLALCGIPAPFDNGQKNPGTEEPSCWTFGRGILSRSRLIQDSWVLFLGESSGLAKGYS